MIDDPLSDAGTLSNSSVESDGGSIGVSWVGERGFFGVSSKRFDTDYGIPARLEDPMVPPPATTDDSIRVDLQQRRYDLRGGFAIDKGALTGIRFGIGMTDYAHRELEGPSVGTTFYTDTAEGRVELTYGRGPRWNGVAGAQLRKRDVEAIGAEAFLPPNEVVRRALFAVQEYDPAGPLRWEFGLRADSTELSTAATVAAEPICADPVDRDFDTLSGSAGVAWIAESGLAVGVSLSRSSRAPGAEELYSCGEHIATLSFEAGEPTLDKESALGLDVSLRKRSGRFSGEINLFRYDYDDFIYEFDTGVTEPPMDPDGLPVFRFAQQGAEFSGLELSGLVELKHGERVDLDLELLGDYVRAELNDGEPVPRIPPLSLGAGLVFDGPHWHGAARVRWYDDQTRIASSETLTRGYTTLNATMGYRLAKSGVVHDFVLRLDNLTDEEIRPHTSRLKDLVPRPGRNVGLNYRLVF